MAGCKVRGSKYSRAWMTDRNCKGIPQESRQCYGNPQNLVGKNKAENRWDFMSNNQWTKYTGGWQRMKNGSQMWQSPLTARQKRSNIKLSCIMRWKKNWNRCRRVITKWFQSLKEHWGLVASLWLRCFEKAIFSIELINICGQIHIHTRLHSLRSLQEGQLKYGTM